MLWNIGCLRSSLGGSGDSWDDANDAVLGVNRWRHPARMPQPHLLIGRVSSLVEDNRFME
jgi:hypothetical protein